MPLSMLALLIATAPAAVFAAAAAAWSPDDIHVSRSSPGQPGSAGSRFEIAQNGDARITIERREGSTHATGTIVLIGGRWMLTQGFAAAPGKELESLDLAVLNSQLVVVLLTAALPDGPPPAGPPQHVRFVEKTNPIRIATATSATEYLAPWTVVGTVTVPAADAEATYELSFTYSDQGLSRTMDFAGSVGKARSPLDFPDSMKLAGWKIRRLPQSLESSLTAADPGSAPHPGAPQAATLGKLRQLN
jgi:hypothetical protein